MAEERTPFLRECAWTGAQFEGKGYILTTTEGTELVSEAAFLAPWQPPEQAPAVDQEPADTEQPPADPTEQP
jgi:hypothetical protein